MQAVDLEQLHSCDWIRHPETRLLYHRSANAIEVYCNGEGYCLPNQPGLLERLQKLCENYTWSQELIHQTTALPALEDLLVKLAEKHAILPISD